MNAPANRTLANMNNVTRFLRTAALALAACAWTAAHAFGPELRLSNMVGPSTNRSSANSPKGTWAPIGVATSTRFNFSGRSRNSRP